MRKASRATLAAAASGALLAGAATDRAVAAPAAMFSNPNPITIVTASSSGSATPASPYPSTISVSGLSGAITDVNVRLNGFGHTFPDDVDMLLVSPTGARLTFMSDACGATTLSGLSLTFDDSAAAGLPDAPPCGTGTFKPTDWDGSDGSVEDFAFPQTATPDPALTPPYPEAAPAGSDTLASAFNGTLPNGTWKLYIVDDAGGDAGTVANGWDLFIEAGGPTAVSLQAFTARKIARGVSLSWRTASEAGIAGYHVWRADANGPSRRVNGSLIAAGRRAAGGGTYRLVDRRACDAGKVAYRLQAVYLEGSKSWLGTARVRN